MLLHCELFLYTKTTHIFLVNCEKSTSQEISCKQKSTAVFFQ